jgi:2-polyprenyl-3-methyl-5-hydroxy-6-metoxy-1,4-benzoquinol methylase
MSLANRLASRIAASVRSRWGSYQFARQLKRDRELSWLYANRCERMDAARTEGQLFPAERAEFHLARYRFATGYVRGQAVADIACGTGYGSEILRAQGGASQVLGVDIDSGAVAYARAHHQPDGVRFFQASGDKTGLDADSVDAVVSFETIEHVPSDVDLLREFHRILRPGGMLICSTPNQWPLKASPFHVREYDRASFEAVLSRGFGIRELYNQNSGSPWPYNHGQLAGIWSTTADNEGLAECYIAVCGKR